MKELGDIFFDEHDLPKNTDVVLSRGEFVLPPQGENSSMKKDSEPRDENKLPVERMNSILQEARAGFIEEFKMSQLTASWELNDTPIPNNQLYIHKSVDEQFRVSINSESLWASMGVRTKNGIESHIVLLHQGDIRYTSILNGCIKMRENSYEALDGLLKIKNSLPFLTNVKFVSA